MKQRELLRKIAPCGLICHTCVAAKGGAIQKHSKAMLRLLDAFDGFADQFSSHEPKLKKYSDFKEVLLLFAGGTCKGCREGNCMYPGCPVWPCIREKGHDFCFECKDFPCHKVASEPLLEVKWRKANKRMKEVGVESYFKEVKNTSHYA